MKTTLTAAALAAALATAMPTFPAMAQTGTAPADGNAQTGTAMSHDGMKMDGMKMNGTRMGHGKKMDAMSGNAMAMKKKPSAMQDKDGMMH